MDFEPQIIAQRDMIAEIMHQKLMYQFKHDKFKTHYTHWSHFLIFEMKQIKW